MKKLFPVVLLFLLALATAASAAQGSVTLDKVGVGDQYVLRQEESDAPLTRSGLNTVRLFSTREGESRFDSSIILQVEDANGEKMSFGLGDIAGYDASFRIEKFVSGNKAEIFLSVNSGGSGGYGFYYIFDFDGSDARVIYDSEKDPLPSHVTGRFIDGYRCAVRTHGETESAVIDLSPRKPLYDKEGVYNPAGGKLLKQVDIWGGSYGSMIPTKHRGVGGTSSLRGTVAFSGLFNADRILTVTITQSYDKGRWHPIGYEIKPWRDLKIVQ